MAWSPAAGGVPKVGVCIPVRDKVSIEWACSFADTLHNAGVQVALFHLGHYEIDYARNDLVDLSLGQHCTHTFFLDSDLLPYEWRIVNGKVAGRAFAGTIPYFLTLEYPIVTGLYWMKSHGRSNLGVFNDDELYRMRGLTFKLEDMVGRRIYVDAAAIGCCLIDNRVFEHIPYPWFHYYRSKERNAEGKWDELSEDFYFCRKARAAGYPILAVGDLVAKHEGRVFHVWGGDAEDHLRP
ncbi:MAG TPA: hypothetical protein VMG81_04265 [Thermoplasmata archaeon]|nr:hypothetical protein [Thermoplasmata archaeon]